MTSLTALAIRLIMCARCEARPGSPCLTITGNRSSYPHSARTAAVYDAWTSGYFDGLRDALDRVRRHIERGRDVDAIEADLEQATRRR